MSNQISKKNLRVLMKQILKSIPNENKEKQSMIVIDYLLSKHLKFKSSKHIALYLAMQQEEIDTHLLVKQILSDNQSLKHIYVPHFELKSNEMKFFEIKNLNQYENEMKVNKFGIRQFTNIDNLNQANLKDFDLVLVPGLAFDFNSSDGIRRLGRGKGYYDSFLSKIPECYTIGIGFNEQFISFNNEFNKYELPITSRDYLLDEFLCEKMISSSDSSFNYL